MGNELELNTPDLMMAKIVSKPRVTVFIPNFNGSYFLQKTIESALGQKFCDFTLHIIDNRSTDSSIEIVQGFKDSRIRLEVNERHVGITENFNRCVNQCETEYCCLLHSDDIYHPDYLWIMVESMDRFSEAVLAHCDFFLINEAGQSFADLKHALKRKIINPMGEPYVFLSAEEELKRLVQTDYVICPSIIYRSSLFRKIGGFDESYSQQQDWELLLRVLLSGERILYVGQKLFFCRLHDKSFSQSQRNLTKYHEYLTLLESVADRIPWVYPRIRFSRKEAHKLTRNILLWDMKNDLLCNDLDSAQRKLQFFDEKIPAKWKASILFLMSFLVQRGCRGGYLLDGLAKAYLHCRTALS